MVARWETDLGFTRDKIAIVGPGQRLVSTVWTHRTSDSNPSVGYVGYVLHAYQETVGNLGANQNRMCARRRSRKSQATIINLSERQG